MGVCNKALCWLKRHEQWNEINNLPPCTKCAEFHNHCTYLWVRHKIVVVVAGKWIGCVQIGGIKVSFCVLSQWTSWLVPLLVMGILSGILIIPTRSSVGTRERKMARIRRASPFPLLMSWRREKEMKIGKIGGSTEFKKNNNNYNLHLPSATCP